MSRRHRDLEATPLPKEERRRTARQIRHDAKISLLASDPDDVVLPEPVRMTPHRAVANTGGRRRFRHWKAPFWKRRNAERHRRNEESVRLA
jgi:DNA-binding helix-hairpin-helix protein with protein kinase domain